MAMENNALEVDIHMRDSGYVIKGKDGEYKGNLMEVFREENGKEMLDMVKEV